MIPRSGGPEINEGRLTYKQSYALLLLMGKKWGEGWGSFVQFRMVLRGPLEEVNSNFIQKDERTGRNIDEFELHSLGHRHQLTSII